MLTIRLQRAGKKNKPEYRVILAEKTAAVNKKFIEILGNYNPHSKVLNIRDKDRLNYWIEKRVEMSPTVNNLFVAQNIITTTKVHAFSIPKKPVEAVAPEAPKAETPIEAPAEPAVESTPETATEAPIVEAAPEPVVEEKSEETPEPAKE